MMSKEQPKILKKVTPTYTLDWYLKWVSSFVLIVGMMLTANNIFPLNLVLHVIGIGGRLVVSLMWNDRALIIINAFGLSIYINGVIKYVTGS